MEFAAACGDELEFFEIRFFTDNTISIVDIDYDTRCFNIT